MIDVVTAAEQAQLMPTSAKVFFVFVGVCFFVVGVVFVAAASALANFWTGLLADVKSARTVNPTPGMMRGFGGIFSAIGALLIAIVMFQLAK